MSGHNFPLDLGEFMKTISKHIFGITYAYVCLIFLYSKQVHYMVHATAYNLIPVLNRDLDYSWLYVAKISILLTICQGPSLNSTY